MIDTPPEVKVPTDLNAAMVLCDMVPLVEKRWTRGAFLRRNSENLGSTDDLRFCMVGAARAALLLRLGLANPNLLDVDLEVPCADALAGAGWLPGGYDGESYLRVRDVERDALRHLATAVDPNAPSRESPDAEISIFESAVVDFNDDKEGHIDDGSVGPADIVLATRSACEAAQKGEAEGQ